MRTVRMLSMPKSTRKQRGVAVITALLLTTLAVTIVASLFWQQQVQVRSIENQRLQLQKQWILRGALDWARLILREDERHSTVDYLGEPWAVPLEETRLDQYVEDSLSDADASEATLSGYITDAQSRYNLTNMVVAGVIQPTEVAAFERLLINLGLNAALAQSTASLMVSAQKAAGNSATTTSGATESAASSGSDAQPMTITTVDDLLAVPGFTPAILSKVRDYVVVLPRPTPVNINTASAEVLAAKVATLSLSQANSLIAARNQAYFRDLTDTRLQNAQIPANLLSVSSSFFLVNGKVRLGRANSSMQAMIERDGLRTTILWTRDM